MNDPMPVSVIVTLREHQSILSAVKTTRAEYGRLLTRLGLDRGVAQQAHDELDQLERAEQVLEQAAEDAALFERAMLDHGELPHPLRGAELVAAREEAAEAAEALLTNAMTVAALRKLLRGLPRSASVAIEQPPGLVRGATDVRYERGGEEVVIASAGT
jgi:hypothetical protein